MAVTIGVGPLPDQGQAFVFLTITVVIQLVALLRGVEIDKGIGIIAVILVAGCAVACFTRLNRAAWCALTVAVCVFKEGRGDPLIYLSVTIVVLPVTGFFRVWVRSGVEIVTIAGSICPILGHRTHASSMCRISEPIQVPIPIGNDTHSLIDIPIAIVIHAITNLFHAGPYGGVIGGTVPFSGHPILIRISTAKTKKRKHEGAIKSSNHQQHLSSGRLV
jgi:hypothetical protein